MIKKLFVYVTILLLVIKTFGPGLVWAQVDPTPTDTPTPTQSVDTTQVDNSATNTNTTNSSANTGNNTTTTDPSVTPTPTDTPSPDPTATPSATPDPSITPDPSATASSDITATNSADVANNVSSSGNTGSNNTTVSGNASPTPTVTPTPTPQVTVTTGDAVSIVAGSNTINTTSVNSNVTDQTINVYGDQTGDIDLSTLFQLVSNIITNDNNNNPVINVQITGVNNYAYVANTITSTANTGGNTTSAIGGTADVTTGNADSVVSLINKVNLTVVNSSLHLVTINIFGHLTGNIILPNITPLQSTACASCGVSFNVNNQATVSNTVDSTANTGTNTTVASGDATITTGNAQSDVNVVNVVNQNILGMIFENLFINEFGLWNGSFLGWDAFAPANAGTLALSSGTPSSTGTTPDGSVSSTAIHNAAVVTNNISSLANTGGNNTTGQNTNVTTGDAYSAVSLINFINSNFFKTLGFFGFINIFGQWDGNIGGADKFITPTPTPDVVADASPNTTQESGGLLSQTNTNNVASYVLPGDTVTFFLTSKNIGTGKVYGATLNLSLFKDGHNVGGTSFNLGDIPVSRGVKVSTGLVLSKNAPAGEYIAKAIVTGTTGPDNTQVSAEADSSFTVFGNSVAINNTQTSNTQGPLHHAVLGARTNKPTPQSDALLLLLLGLTLGSYLTIKGIRNRKLLKEIWESSSSFKQKLMTVRILLL